MFEGQTSYPSPLLIAILVHSIGDAVRLYVIIRSLLTPDLYFLLGYKLLYLIRNLAVPPFRQDNHLQKSSLNVIYTLFDTF